MYEENLLLMSPKGNESLNLKIACKLLKRRNDYENARAG